MKRKTDVTAHPRYRHRNLYEVVIFEKGYLVGFVAFDGAFRYSLPQSSGYDLKTAKKLLRRKIVKDNIKRGREVFIVKTTRICTVMYPPAVG